MGILTTDHKKTIINSVISGISGNTSNYYGVAIHNLSIPVIGNSHAVSASYGPAPVPSADFATRYLAGSQAMFGKKIQSTDIVPVIVNNVWNSNTAYIRYDNTSNSMYLNNNYYAVVAPTIVGGDYIIYKCIDNANGAPSTIRPDLVQLSTFTKADGYKWRYMYSISTSNYNKFATASYVPVYSNTIVITQANGYNGIDVLPVYSSGNGYTTYHSGYIRGIVNNTVLQIENSGSNEQQFYVNSAIYTYNSLYAGSQLLNITNYISNSTGNFVYTNTASNTTNITPAITQYQIAPAVNIIGDGNIPARAYSTVNTISNSITGITIIDPGAGYTYANTYITSKYGNGCFIYPIIANFNGHGTDPIRELNATGYAIAFTFANTEANTVTTNISYSTIGIIKDPGSLLNNYSKGTSISNNTFNQLLKATVSGSAIFTVDDKVIGSTSKAVGTVVFSNSTALYLTGDKKFSAGELIVSSNGLTSTNININTLGDIYTTDLNIEYLQNISGVSRANTQSESFLVIIQV